MKTTLYDVTQGPYGHLLRLSENTQNWGPRTL